MKLSSIPQLYRNVNRFREIVTILSKYQLAAWLQPFQFDLLDGLFKDTEGSSLMEQSSEVRIRTAVTELGPTFIKTAQILSTRPDVLGVELCNELKKLQSDVPADPPDAVRSLIEAELGQPLGDIYVDFSDKPLGSASIGQVHRAYLKTGEEVVVKVQHKGIANKIVEDLDILLGLAQLAENVSELKPYQPVQTVEELQKSLLRELDFQREVRNLQMFTNNFSEEPKIRIPQPFPEFCSKRILTMEMLDGAPLKDPEELEKKGFDLEALATTGAQAYLRMIFNDGLFHADPHPGNLILLEDDVIGLIDFGMVGRLDSRLRDEIEEMLLSLAIKDAEQLTASIMRVGSVPKDVDTSGFSGEISEFISFYGTQSLDKFDLGGAMNELTSMIRRYRITLPVQISLLLKVIVTLEGTAKMLNPKFNLLEVMKPFQQQILVRRLSPERHLKKARRLYGDLERLAEVLPKHLLEIIEMAREGKLEMHMEHRGLEPSVNRIVFGLLTSALFLGSSLMLSFKVPPLLFPSESVFGFHQLSVLGLGGYIMSLLFGIRLYRAFWKSGHLNQKKND